MLICLGARTDLDELHNSLQAGKSLQDISNEHFVPFLKYQRGICAHKFLNESHRSWVTEVHVYWGATGTGKTRKVYDENTDVWVHAEGSWFDGYEGNENVLFDDFHGGVFKLPYLLKLLDRYPMRVPIKGGFVQWKPKKVFITSNIDPAMWFMSANKEHVLALNRRFTEVLEFQ